MENMEVLQELNNYLEEHFDFATTIEKTNNGYIILFYDMEERDAIYNWLESKYQLEDFPCETAFKDEVQLCDFCHKVVSLIPLHAFWQPNFVRIDDNIICDDCINVEEYIDIIKNRMNVCLRRTMSTIENLESLGFVNWTKEKYNKDFSTNYEDDLKQAMEEYEDCFFYCYDSTPFEADMILFVRNKK